MTDTFITVRGYAIPFGRTIACGPELEVIERNAFVEMLAGPQQEVPIIWNHHPGWPLALANSVELFSDDHGLAFQAVLDMRPIAGRPSQNWTWLRWMTSGHPPADQVSVGLQICRQIDEAYRGLVRRRVTKARIDHIAIVQGDAAYGGATGAWPCHGSLENAAPRIRQLAASWESGRRAWLSKQSAKQADVRAAVTLRSSPIAANGRSTYAPAMMSRHAQYREAFALAALAGRIPSGAVFGHAAFSKVAGWDGNFNQLLGSVRAKSP